MERTPGIPTRYRLRVKLRLAVVEYGQAIRHQAGESAIWVSETNCSAVVAQLATRRHPAIGAPGTPRGDGVGLGMLITQARLEHEFGASRARIWLERVHHVRPWGFRPGRRQGRGPRPAHSVRGAKPMVAVPAENTSLPVSC
jgi:hypothetical protein